MLRQLSIRNLAVIEQITLEFADGFHVFTGETGAGKSIVMDALSLIAGGRGSSDWIRYGADKAEIEALFDPPAEHPVWDWLSSREWHADPSESLIIRRELTRSGKSSCRINGQMANLSMLKEMGPFILELHGQQEHQSLSKPETHLSWLDAFGGKVLETALNDYREKYKAYISLDKQYRSLLNEDRQAVQQADLYRFQLQEIRAVKPKAGEDDQLELERKLLQSAEKRIHHANSAYEALSGPNKGLVLLHKALKHAQDLASFDPETMHPVIEQLQSAYYQAEDALHVLRDYAERVDTDPKRLDQLEGRLEELRKLKRKYGATIEDILQHKEQIEGKLAQMDNRDELLAALEKEKAAATDRLRASGEQLRKHREAAADALCSKVEQELTALQMPRARLSVEITPRSGNAFGPDGMEQAEFLLRSNPGEPPRPMAKIASGGELSRIMLALKTIFARLSSVGLLVFDEVDTGVSGRAAQAIAEKLAECAQFAQVFAVSHLPQMAGMADHQWLVEKRIESERTYTDVRELDHTGRVDELSRMISGAQLTGKTKEHAAEMLEAASNYKQTLSLMPSADPAQTVTD